MMTAANAQKSSFHARVAAATVADVMRIPLPTVGQHDHVAAAAYLMKHAGTTALLVADAQTGRPAGIITEANVARAIADGKDVNNTWVDAVMTTRPAITTMTSIRDAAKIMTTRHLRHLPVTGGTGLLGVVDIIDVCQALISAEEGAATTRAPAPAAIASSMIRIPVVEPPLTECEAGCRRSDESADARRSTSRPRQPTHRE